MDRLRIKYKNKVRLYFLSNEKLLNDWILVETKKTANPDSLFDLKRFFYLLRRMVFRSNHIPINYIEESSNVIWTAVLVM